jgi:hypothetical protein
VKSNLFIFPYDILIVLQYYNTIMQLSTIIYGIVVIVLIIVISIVSVLATTRKIKADKCPPIPPAFRSVMGVRVNYREEEKEIKRKDSSTARLSQYNEDAANEVAVDSFLKNEMII